jgi:hypothetical protein
MMEWLQRLLEMDHEIERQRVLHVIKRELPEDTFAVVRLSWFSEYGIESVDEIWLIYEGQGEEDMIPKFSSVVAQALQSGADVSILTDIEPELLGFFDE